MPVQSVIVTGAAGGIGSATVRALVARGAQVFAVDLDRRVNDLPEELGARVVAHIADVTDDEAVELMVAAAVERFGRLDGLHNNAGILGEAAAIDSFPVDMFDRVLATNLRSVLLVTKHAVPHLRRAGRGAILNTASTGALVGAPGMTAYIAAKHAVLGLTRAFALELADDGIAVNALCPGPTDTRMMSAFFESNSLDPVSTAKAMTPMGRMALPEEIGATAAWLLLEAPVFLTGTPVVVDGGQTAT